MQREVARSDADYMEADAAEWRARQVLSVIAISNYMSHRVTA